MSRLRGMLKAHPILIGVGAVLVFVGSVYISIKFPPQEVEEMFGTEFPAFNGITLEYPSYEVDDKEFVALFRKVFQRPYNEEKTGWIRSGFDQDLYDTFNKWFIASIREIDHAYTLGYSRMLQFYERNDNGKALMRLELVINKPGRHYGKAIDMWVLADRSKGTFIITSANFVGRVPQNKGAPSVEALEPIILKETWGKEDPVTTYSAYPKNPITGMQDIDSLIARQTVDLCTVGHSNEAI